MRIFLRRKLDPEVRLKDVASEAVYHDDENLHADLQIEKLHSQRWTQELLNGQYQTNRPHLSKSKVCLTDVAVISDFTRDQAIVSFAQTFHILRKGEEGCYTQAVEFRDHHRLGSAQITSRATEAAEAAFMGQ
ncbi:hypothetical protein KIN20_026534 [Parelaphostrongylus tenuis]|uniref:Uncharacterized protein n=1 Tax=Parelaphostrongylus tenuis TaxID=148309 RepID=A0AAD5WD57_PARTN|nr:hypothetical protein KIN20_026534 [Parelaphostrongylus tenuis]